MLTHVHIIPISGAPILLCKTAAVVMADETSSNPGVGARAWQNSVVRATIIRHANNATLAKLLRVDKETFQLGARELYKYVPDYKVFKERLSSLQNSVSVCHRGRKA